MFVMGMNIVLGNFAESGNKCFEEREALSELTVFSDGLSDKVFFKGCFVPENYQVKALSSGLKVYMFEVLWAAFPQYWD